MDISSKHETLYERETPAPVHSPKFVPPYAPDISPSAPVLLYTLALVQVIFDIWAVLHGFH